MDNLYFLNGAAPVLNVLYVNIHHLDGTITEKVSVQYLRKAIKYAEQSTNDEDKHQSFAAYNGTWHGLYRFNELDLC